jgi:NAD(P)-dependent dehydrogenase (short-subunit alcohol dehydrogenase family)
VAAELGGAKAIACDIRDDAALDELVATTVDSFGRIDGLVNNAGANFSKPFMQTTEQDWEWVVSLDLRAVFFLPRRSVGSC